MAEKVLIQGESGTGKTFSMKDLDPNTTVIVSPEKLRLPFRTQFKMLYGETDSKKIISFMDDSVKKGAKVIVIDDFQYILAIPYMNRIHESGWEKYNDFGGNYFEIIDHCKKLPEDVIVYFLTHTEQLEDGITRTKLIGKLLREKITIEGLFTIVLRTVVADGKYYFATQNSGKDTTKTPYGMFETYAIENNLKYVDDKIRNFYYMDGSKTDEEIAAEDEEIAAPEVEKPSGRRRRASTSTPAPAEEKSEKTEEAKPSSRRRRTGIEEKFSDKFMDIPESVANPFDEEAELVQKAVDEVANGAEDASYDEVQKKVEEMKAETPAPARRRRRTRE